MRKSTAKSRSLQHPWSFQRDECSAAFFFWFSAYNNSTKYSLVLRNLFFKKGWTCQNGFMWEWYFILKGNKWGLEWLSNIFRWKMKWKWSARLDQLRSDHAMKFIDVVDVFKLKHGKNMVKRCTINQIIGAVICNCKNGWLQHYIGASNYYFKWFSIYSCCNEFKVIHRFVLLYVLLLFAVTHKNECWRSITQHSKTKRTMNSFVFNVAQRTIVMFFDVQYKREINSFRNSFCLFWICGLYKECGFHKQNKYKYY